MMTLTIIIIIIIIKILKPLLSVVTLDALSKNMNSRDNRKIRPLVRIKMLSLTL